MNLPSQRPLGLPVMCLLAVAVGLIAGLGAWVFRLLIGLFHNLLFLGQFSFSYDANVHTPASPWGAGVVLVPVVGAVIVVWLVKSFAPEAKGHGVPEVIDAIYYGGGRIRPVVAVVKSLASAISIGSGGSVGREGPIIQIGAAFGSSLGQWCRIPARQRITLIAAGAGGGIAATFNAPLGGVVFAVELLLVSVNARNLLPVGLSTVTACHVGRWLLGTHPAFDFGPLQVPNFRLESSGLLLLLIPFGLLMGLVCTAFVRGIYWTEDHFDALPLNDYLRHMLGMGLVGVMIYLLQRYAGHYYVQGVGYATIMDVITGVLTDPGLLLLLCLLKFAATCLTLGSGGSGGVFSPALYMGATVGALYGQALHLLLPDLGIEPVIFPLAGMAAAISGSTGAILTSSVMLMEMTDDVNVTIPIITASAVAYGVRKWISPESIYTLKLTRRGHVSPQGLQAGMMEAHRTGDIASTDFRLADHEATATMDDVPTIFIKDGEIVRVTVAGGNPLPSDTANTTETSGNLVIVSGQTPLIEALRTMDAAGVDCLVVVKSGDSQQGADVVGVVTSRELTALHHKMANLL